MVFATIISIVSCDSHSEQATDNKSDTNDPNYVSNKLDEINKKTDQVKGFINDIPKFLESINAIQKAEKEIADKIASDEAKVKAAKGVGRKKRYAEPQVAAGESYKPENVNVISKDELVHHSIDYINNTLPEVKSKLVSFHFFLRLFWARSNAIYASAIEYC